ncbi:hypothetical protein K491DRAFT_685244 [Lophiostoma macrostomum CBS 122681]|uniref:Uncharacterized protein n=1 Tax=Lophiostoma macrostomum CBS 122681 TaxID=1314788 RepID=A0A6A6SIU3_9PLEO|nr:hypothetical protein K491DRAFT_685244 [Lophiostoma macrostomum CBS 122681]
MSGLSFPLQLVTSAKAMQHEMDGRQSFDNARTLTRLVQALHQRTTSSRAIIAPNDLERWVGPGTDPAVGLSNAYHDNIDVDNGRRLPMGFPFAAVKHEASDVLFFASSIPSSSILVIRAWTRSEGVGIIKIFGGGGNRIPQQLMSSIMATLTLASKNPCSPFTGIRWTNSLAVDPSSYNLPAALSLALRLLPPASFPLGWMQVMDMAVSEPMNLAVSEPMKLAVSEPKGMKDTMDTDDIDMMACHAAEQEESDSSLSALSSSDFTSNEDHDTSVVVCYDDQGADSDLDGDSNRASDSDDDGDSSFHNQGATTSESNNPFANLALLDQLQASMKRQGLPNILPGAQTQTRQVSGTSREKEFWQASTPFVVAMHSHSSVESFSGALRVASIAGSHQVSLSVMRSEFSQALPPGSPRESCLQVGSKCTTHPPTEQTATPTLRQTCAVSTARLFSNNHHRKIIRDVPQAQRASVNALVGDDGSPDLLKKWPATRLSEYRTIFDEPKRPALFYLSSRMPTRNFVAPAALERGKDTSMQ